MDGNIGSSTTIFNTSFKYSAQISTIINVYNESHYKMQITAIKKCLSLIDMRTSYSILPYKVIDEINQIQIYNSKKWCIDYNVELNPKCKFKL